MSSRASNLNSCWADWIIEELTRHGISVYYLSSGSRCTPLTVAIARRKNNIRSIIHLDERGLAFAAVGYARATGKPAAVVTTSGTAMANLLPGVVEASQQRLPLLCLTADRPPELHDCGANQTMPQAGLFDQVVRKSVEIDCPSESISPAELVSTIDDAVLTAIQGTPGPVHLNAMFRDPLEPSNGPPVPATYQKQAQAWLDSGRPMTGGDHSYVKPLSGGERLSRIIKEEAAYGVIVAADGADALSALRLGEIWQWPVCTDLGSGARLGSTHGLAIPHYDWILEGCELQHEVDTVLWLGDRVIGKSVPNAFPHAKHWIQATPHGAKQDPGNRVTHRVEMATAAACKSWEQMCPSIVSREWAGRWQRANKAVAQTLDRWFEKTNNLLEPLVGAVVAESCEMGTGLVVGNSLPVRDIQLFSRASGNRLSIALNRGVSGIDGMLSTAAGFAVGLERSVIAVVGDLSALHDLNALKLIAQIEPPVTVVVVNNLGGGIFAQLPIVQHEDVFREWFLTPHEVKFEHAAALFGIAYDVPTSIPSLRESLRHAKNRNAPALIEVHSDLEEGLQAREDIRDDIITALASRRL